MTEISPFTFTEVKTSAMSPSEIFSSMSVMLKKLFTKTTNEELFEAITDSAMMSLGKLKLNFMPMSKLTLLPLKLFSQGLRPDLQEKGAFKFMYTKRLNVFENVEVFAENTVQKLSRILADP